ncbi:MAG: three-Cys-motif partner protein TcmP [Phyllobacteriaceae bacterium]|nr:three-Cys-motif partner protein TcmP [Phyllobacteriaceae bacterium]
MVKYISKHRAVIFLDPYALQVEWSTLELLAKTQRVDVWYLFPLRDVVRQLANRLDRVGPKERRLDLVLGSNWRDLYRTSELMNEDLFGERRDPSALRSGSKADVEQWFSSRLRKIFAFVPDPLPILGERGSKDFSLYLCVANPAKPAVDLAKNFAKHAARNHSQRG